MNRPRSFEQRLEAWLEEGPASAPPDLLDQLLDSETLTNPRRRRFGAARRLLVLSSSARFAAAVAAVLVIGVVGFSLILSKVPSIGGVGATPTPITTVVPSTSASVVPNVALCAPEALAAQVKSWDGAAGHRTATVELRNTGTVACQTAVVDRPQLVDGNGAVIIDGLPAVNPASITLAAGAVVRGLVQDGNYCGPTPVAPVTVGFVLTGGGGRVLAAPLTATDDTGIPPCNGNPGSAGDIEMQPWAP